MGRENRRCIQTPTLMERASDRGWEDWLGLVRRIDVDDADDALTIMVRKPVCGWWLGSIGMTR